MPTNDKSDCGCHGSSASAEPRPAAAELRTARLAASRLHSAAETERAASVAARGATVRAASAARLTAASRFVAPPPAGTPMELLGASAGITIIDPATVLTRLWYFDGRFLRAEGFRLDQEYVRSLVSLSNRAVGTGIVHGLDVDLLGDRLRVEGGLGLAPSGRVVHLASSTDLGIAELVARSTGVLQKASLGASGAPDFAPCPPDSPGTSDEPVAHRNFYVLTAAAAEALCGEEERFGQLCGDACSADVDRSVAVEGVRFRARRVSLALAASRTVPFTATHLRSQVASAFFRLERTDIPSMISGAGLRTTVWCDGAEGIDGEEIPLAIFDRSGTITTFADMWTARREIVESSPQRYWQWRRSMRPLDVFLAQVLQFQCQLADLPSGAATPAASDPCADERDALVDVHEVLGVLGEAGADIADRLGELRERVSKVLAGTAQRGSGSLLIDRGIIETPSAGYLPVDPKGDVTAQTMAWFGPGVDLRFCAVRPDFIPEALQEAQHMERISLTQGIDDPRDVEEVDILVPGGSFQRRTISTLGYEGTFDVLPLGASIIRGGEERAAMVEASAERAALRLSAVAREHDSGGWSWTLAAFGEAPQRLAVGDLVSRIDATIARGIDTESFSSVHLEDAADLDAIRLRSAVGTRALREASGARARSFRVAEAGFLGARVDESDESVGPRERRAVALWFDAQSARALDDIPIGGTTSLTLRLVLYSRASTAPAFLDLGVAGTATVRDRQVTSTGVGGTAVVTVETSLDGAANVFTVSPDAAAHVVPLSGARLVWRIQTSPAGRRLDGVTFGMGERSVLEARFVAEGDPRHLAGRISASASRREAVVATRTGLAAFELTEKAGVFDLGSPGRDLASSVIDIVGAELLVRRGDSTFEDAARRRILPDAAAPTETISAATDWIMFHRRRVKDCGESAAPTPTRVIRYRWLHGISEFPERTIERLRAAAGSGEEGTVLEILLKEIDVSAVAAVEFAEGSTELASSVAALRTAWTTSDRGGRLVAGMSARWGAGESAAIEGGRLSAGIRALAGLVDATDALSVVLESAPASVQSEGFDGVFLTIGAAVETAHADLVRTTRERWMSVREAFAGTSPTRAELLRRLAADDQLFVAEFDGPDLVNGEKVAEWWTGAPQADFDVALILDRGIPPLGASGELWTQRREPAVREVATGGGNATELTSDIEVDLEGAGALIVFAFAIDR